MPNRATYATPNRSPTRYGPLLADGTYSSFKSVTNGLLLVDPRDGRTSGGAGTRRLRSVLELHAFRTAHHVGRAEGMQLTCGDQERVHGAHISPAADARLGACSLLTSHSVRGGRSLLAQTGRSEQGDVRSQSRRGLGLTPRPPPSVPSDSWSPPTTCGMAAASRGSHDRGRVKLSRTASKPNDHARGPRRAGDKPILFIHRPTPCTPAGAVPRGNFRRVLHAGIAGSGRIWASQLRPPARPRPAPAAGATAGAVGSNGNRKGA